MFVVTVHFQINRDVIDTFMDLMEVNASVSLDQEPGLSQFDVLTDPDRIGDVFLYEVYANRAAFDAHLSSRHFKSFDDAVADMVASKEVRTYSGLQR